MKTSVLNCYHSDVAFDQQAYKLDNSFTGNLAFVGKWSYSFLNLKGKSSVEEILQLILKCGISMI